MFHSLRAGTGSPAEAGPLSSLAEAVAIIAAQGAALIVDFDLGVADSGGDRLLMGVVGLANAGMSSSALPRTFNSPPPYFQGEYPLLRHIRLTAEKGTVILHCQQETHMTDPQIFHTSRYAGRSAMLEGLAEAIWTKLHPDDASDDEPDLESVGHIILVWFDPVEDGEGYDVRVSRIPGDTDDDDIEEIGPDFYITTYDEDVPETIHEDLLEVVKGYLEEDD
jgi:hypothetical protein